MGCDGCDSRPTPADKALFQQVFTRFWPPGSPFPPMAPYLGAAVGRQEALAWAVAIGADHNSRVLSGDTQAILDMVGRALMDPSEVFAEARKKKKKSPERPTLPTGTGCYETTCYGTVPPINQTCCPTEDLATYRCTPACPSDTALSGDSQPAASTGGPT